MNKSSHSWTRMQKGFTTPMTTPSSSLYLLLTIWLLVYNGSSADILYYPAFQQMRLGRDQLHLVNFPLVRFGRMKVQPVGTIILPVVVGAYLQQITKDVNFLVVDCSSSSNVIIGRPALNSWKAVTSTYHLSVNFPIEYGVGQLQGDQLATRECYLTMLAMDE